MLTKRQQLLYNSFYDSTHNNEYLDNKTEVLVGLAAALAMDCKPCTLYYINRAKKANVSKEEISEVLAKVMAVAAGQKRLQMKEVIETYNVDLETYV
ncbi:MAG: carboxymuconolactone decarboxylase family protein [Gammaproteobacteria bacterium]|jgi:alkylhydroperoxidase/carboxymuconolactone decarboxylase family protein YurZ|nr:carboxymuconolactone decarboxylase family protein [Gammaproteobacteria bacterium]